MESSRFDLAFVIPSKDEEKGIGIVLSQVREFLEKKGLKGLIVVSDSSKDETPKIAKEMGAEVIYPDKNGYGYAYLYAFKYLKKKYGYPRFVVMIDADGTYDARETEKLLSFAEKADIVLGSRFSGKIEPGAMSLLHRIGNRILNGFLNFFFKANVSDSHTGFRVVKGEVLEKIDLKCEGMEFASEMIVKAVKNGMKIAEVPITYRRRAGGEPKIRSFQDGWRHLRFMLLNTPKHLFIYPGISMLFLGFLLMIFAIFKIKTFYTPGINSAIAGGFLTLIGFQILSFGMFSNVFNKNKKYLSLEKNATVGLLLFLFGILLISGAVLEWISSGFKFLPTSELNVFFMVITALGLQIIFLSFMLSLIEERDRDEKDEKRC
ncbi:MAG: glycosyltransferase family 2 protein [Archaeoglobaceae archaeon]|nr:glycosyltransferase family 2 protein [Archaeoglobaceae archaeon]MCX8151418.1 glycosyltransferase family 2 protein [Archaeoglobaceae archaeon]